MEQPALGQKIVELRNDRRITQKELAELCKVDIRTIQRIESGDVDPRTYTINLLSEALGYDFKEYPVIEEKQVSAKSLKLALLSGVIFSINSILVVIELVHHSITGVSKMVVFSIHSITPLLFYYAFYLLGKRSKNTWLAISAILMIIILPLINVLYLNTLSLLRWMNELRLTYDILLLVCIAFGIGAIFEGLKKTGHLKKYYLTAGIMTVIQPVMYISYFMLAAGLYLSIVSDLLLTVILSLEYQKVTGKSVISYSKTLLS